MRAFLSKWGFLIPSLIMAMALLLSSQASANEITVSQTECGGVRYSTWQQGADGLFHQVTIEDDTNVECLQDRPAIRIQIENGVTPDQLQVPHWLHDSEFSEQTPSGF